MSRFAVISGGSSGIGLATVNRLIKRGYQVFSLSRSTPFDSPPQVTHVKCDVSSYEDLEKARKTISQETSSIDVLVANAGLGRSGKIIDLSFNQIAELINVNLLGTIYFVKTFYPLVANSQHADIIGIVSEAGRRGFPMESAYCASKFGALGFFRSLDHEAREDGIRISSISPGGVNTRFAIGDGRGRTAGDEELNEMLSADYISSLIETVIDAPRDGRILEIVTRSMSEASWG